MGYRFEWDPKKAQSNLRKHGVAFEEASTVFGDPLSLLMPDPDHSLDEERYLVLRHSGRRRLLAVAFVERFPRTRLISARQATPRERILDEKES
ncbi:MAG TPA: BrnT family toxin [Terriglobia bacterium]|nr:BrnT family toxin [Terriglobia bacterium]